MLVGSLCFFGRLFVDASRVGGLPVIGQIPCDEETAISYKRPDNRAGLIIYVLVMSLYNPSPYTITIFIISPLYWHNIHIIWAIKQVTARFKFYPWYCSALSRGINNYNNFMTSMKIFLLKFSGYLWRHIATMMWRHFVASSSSIWRCNCGMVGAAWIRREHVPPTWTLVLALTLGLTIALTRSLNMGLALTLSLNMGLTLAHTETRNRDLWIGRLRRSSKCQMKRTQ